MDQGKWHSWELGSSERGRAYHRGMDMLGLLRKYLVEETCLVLEGGNTTHLRQLMMDALACYASPRGTPRLVWLSVSASPAYLTSCSHHGPSWLGKMLGSSRWSQPTTDTREQVTERPSAHAALICEYRQV